MSEGFKKIITAVFSFIAILMVLYVSVIFYISNILDLDKYKLTVFQEIENKTGYKISCEKAIFEKNFSPYLKLHLYHTGIKYPDNKIFLQIKEANLKIKIFPLFFKKIEIKNIELNRPIVNITLYKDLTNSVDFAPSIAPFITLENILSKNYKIKFFDKSINKTFYLEGDELFLSNIKLNDSVNIKTNGLIFTDKKDYIKYDLDVIIPAINLTPPPPSNTGARGCQIFVFCPSNKTDLNKNFKLSFSPFKTLYETEAKGSIYGNFKTDFKNNIHGNLKIKDLSLNLGNTVSKNNNADIIFNGTNAQINAVIHTSLKDSAKIKGKFGVNKKRYIDFDMSADNVDIENLFKTTNALTKILNIKNPLNNLSAKGLLNANFNIKSDLKKINSKGTAQIINASLSHKNFKYPIVDVNANINFNNNEIKIEKAQSKVNNALIKLEGSIKNDLTLNLKAFSDNLDLNTIANSFFGEIPFDIKKGTIDFKTEINGKFGKNLKTLSEIYLKNLHFSENKYKIPINIKNCKINFDTENQKYRGNVKIDNADLIYGKTILKTDNFKFLFDEKNIDIPIFNAKLVNSPFQIEGAIKNYNTAPVVKINYTGDINADDVAFILSEFIKYPCKPMGKLNTKGIFDIEGGKLKLKSQINADKDNYISYVVIKELLNKPSVTRINIETDKNAIMLKDISISNGNETQIKIKGMIEDLKSPVFKNFNIVVPNFISVASNFFGGEEISFKSDLILDKSIKNPEIKGSAKISRYNLKKYLTSIKNTDINFFPENIRINAPEVVVNESSFNIKADIVPDLKNLTVSNMYFNSMNLDVISLLNILKELPSITVKNGSSTINAANIGDIKARDVSNDFKIEKNIIKITNINASAYSGYVQGSGDYDLNSGILNVDMRGKNLNIKNSMYDLCRFKDNLEGQTDVKINVSMLTGTYNTAIKTLSGIMEFNARNGSMGSLGKFEYYLYAQNLLYHGVLNTTLNRLVQAVSHNDTTHYKLADGSILFQNGYMITDNLHTQGDNMSLFIKGRHNMLTNQSNIDIYGRISDEITKKLGNFGDISISDIVNGGQNQKNNIVMILPNEIINEIKPLYKKTGLNSNTFKVNVLGKFDALNSINSFTWVVPEKAGEIEENRFLPDFSDL